MKNIVVVPNVLKDRAFEITDTVVTKLLDLGFNVFVSASVKYERKGVFLYEKMPIEIDLIIVVGGDGSVIDASIDAIERNIPILGVNLGKVGYLAEVEPHNIDLLDRLSTGDYSIMSKMLLSAEFGNTSDFSDRYAVNDVVISREGLLHIADIKIEDSIGNSMKIRADGVILSTPQGSTAYSFSTGGPIVAHNVESILLTPISPHSFFNRSVLFNSSDVIKVTNCGELPVSVNIDGRCAKQLAPAEVCEIRKAPVSFKMLTFTENNMFSSLFKKMRILGDIG